MDKAEKAQKIERQKMRDARKAKEHREDRRNQFWIYGTGAVLLIALILPVTIVSVKNQKEKSRLIAQAAKPIDGVQSYRSLTRNHTSKQVAYSLNPPAGGDHAGGFINCGIYTHPINNWEAVHSMEHGAVWVTYRPSFSSKEIGILRKIAASRPYVLLSPYSNLSSPVVASAWGKQLMLESASDPRLALFLQAYLQGVQTPEPGAPCSGGVQG